MASDLEIEIAKALNQHNGSQATVRKLGGYSKTAVSRVSRKMARGKITDADLLDAPPVADDGNGSGNINLNLEEAIKEKKPKEKAPKSSPADTSNLGQASFIRIEPKSFRMTSRVFWDAYEAVTNTWLGWQGMGPAEFLDAYLEITLMQRGILIGGYTVLDQVKKEEADGEVHNS